MKAIDGRWALEKDTLVAAQALAQRGERLREAVFCLLLLVLVKLLLLQRLLQLQWRLRRRKRRVRLMLLLTMLAVTVLTMQVSHSRRMKRRPVGQRCDRRERGHRRRQCPPHWRRIRMWWGEAHRVVRHYRHRRRRRRCNDSAAALMLAGGSRRVTGGQCSLLWLSLRGRRRFRSRLRREAVRQLWAREQQGF